jgi:hypothetical protein
MGTRQQQNGKSESSRSVAASGLTDKFRPLVLGAGLPIVSAVNRGGAAEKWDRRWSIQVERTRARKVHYQARMAELHRRPQVPPASRRTPHHEGLAAMAPGRLAFFHAPT